MPIPGDRRTRKRLATRQAISDAATRLFFERGYDRVTVDEIAEAADVGRMTVFNHFPRKEDIFFDLDDLGREELVAALSNRPAGMSPVEAVDGFVHEAVVEQRPYVRFFEGSRRFLATIEQSEALTARARALRDELAEFLQAELQRSVGLDAADSDAELAAHLFLASWTVAYLRAHDVFDATDDPAAARDAFLEIADKGARAVKAALAATPYHRTETAPGAKQRKPR